MRQIGNQGICSHALPMTSVHVSDDSHAGMERDLKISGKKNTIKDVLCILLPMVGPRSSPTKCGGSLRMDFGVGCVGVGLFAMG